MTTVSPDKDEVERATDCPECGGAGWVCATDAACCGRSEYECGGRGCSGPEQVQTQEQCEYCGGNGRVPLAAMSPVDRLREALEACREKFAEYVELHKAKLHDGTPTAEWLSVRRKVDRNQEMVDLCDAALSSPEPVGEVGE